VDFSDGVVVEDDSLCITSERAQYSRSTKESYAWTNVVVRNKKSHVILVGDSAFNQPSAGYSRVEGNAMLEQCEQIPAASASTPSDSASSRVPATPAVTSTPQRKGKKRTNVIQPIRKSSSEGSTVADSSRSAAVHSVADSLGDSLRVSIRDSSKKTIDTLTIRAQRMESLRQTARDRYMAEGNVEIVRGTLATRSSRCMYDNTDETFELRGDPMVWADSLALHADSVVMQFNKRKLVQLHAAGSAFVLFRDTVSAVRSQQIGAQLIDIDVRQDTVRLVSARRDASSLYFMQGDEGPDGASRTACDSLFVLFSAGKPDSIVWRSGVSGEYYPENLVGDGPSRYYLPHYKDIGTRPRKVDLNARLQRDVELRKRRDTRLP
jgi:lipopolysaccharide export system protein LptA